MRTLPFQDQPLDAQGMDGVFLNCRLDSDDEAERRMWKMTVRTDGSRGEQVYQAQFDLKEAIEEAKKVNGAGDGWAHVRVPFDEFLLVRGPRLMPDGPKLDVAGGIFQIGMTMSKFKMAVNTTELENFRAGFFDMHIQKIGFYSEETVSVKTEVEVDSDTNTVKTNVEDEADAVVKSEGAASESVSVPVLNVPDTLTKKEAEKKRPLPLKILLPVAKLLFSEKANRRKGAMNILREKRNMSRTQAILFGIRNRRKSIGLIPSILKTAGILGVDSARAVLKNSLKVVLLYPLRLFGMIVRNVKKMLGMKVTQKPSLKE